ncbi:hypothetical protein [Mycolicibacterium sp. NCC-Tsukiji]|uniref:hypothetical protein n=1 Tax=Mycolicibacterium sp. NCC-Tsukiji TaxID=2185272 RepID=UPI001FCE65FD|nr:hypothetical protein [Mycolicibacterium sp. NCC-Tsukiji]
MAPRYIARLRYGRPLPYSEVKPPMVATSPADTSPAAHPTRIGTIMQNEARSANGQRRGTAFMTSMRRSGLVAGAGAERSAMCTACGTSSR